MQDETLLAHVATMISPQPENVATTSLHYLLGRSEKLRHVLIGLCGDLLDDLPLNLAFDAQPWLQGEGVPDLVGLDTSGRERLIVEAKFGASLTDHQPKTYLHRLPPGHSGAVLMLVPSFRAETLWTELRQACEKDIPYHLGEDQIVRPRWYAMALPPEPPRHALILTTWRELLERMQHALHAGGDQPLLDDLKQLGGLCDKMDTEPFEAIREDELVSVSAARLRQFQLLPKRVAKEAESQNILTDISTNFSEDNYGYWAKMQGAWVLITLDAVMWSHYGTSPLWLRIYPLESNERWEEVRPKLLGHETLGIERDPMEREALLMPLRLTVNVPEAGVLRDLQRQLQQVADMMGGRIQESP